VAGDHLVAAAKVAFFLMAMKRVCLISTVKHNVGDDFVRAGVLWLLQRLVGDEALQVRVIHKHFPLTARAGRWIQVDRLTRPFARLRPLLNRLDDLLPLDPTSDEVLNCDWLVQSGAPVYWNNAYSACAQTEWFGPLIDRRWHSLKAPVPLLNLGAGSCLALSSDGAEVFEEPACRDFVQRFGEAALVTTVRDRLAQTIIESCGQKAPLLACPSLFAPWAIGVEAGAGDYVALNYMAGGGHYDLAGEGGEKRCLWEERFVQEARRLAKSFPCRLICHDPAELAEAKRVLPELPAFYSGDWQDYVRVYAGCRMALVNRVHAGMVTAAAGKPVVLVGNDSRLLTAELVPWIRCLAFLPSAEALTDAVEETLKMGMLDYCQPFLKDLEQRYLTELAPLLAR
jgi:hypothetical protein